MRTSKADKPTLTRIATAVPCSVCPGTEAHWRIDQFPVCNDCIIAMSSMNGDNEEFFKPAVDEVTSLEEVGK